MLHLRGQSPLETTHCIPWLAVIYFFFVLAKRALTLSRYPKEKPAEGGARVAAHVLQRDVRQAVEQQQGEAAGRLEPLATNKKRPP